MSWRQKLEKEMREVAQTTLYFGVCFGVLVGLKQLYLAEYHIKFRGLWLALVGALIVAKVVLVMEHVRLGQWVHRHAVAIGIILRTLLYTLGVFVALVLEKGFEGRHEHGGFGGAVVWIFQHRDVHNVWADTIVVGCALLGFNALSALRQHLGEGQLRRVFLSPPRAISKVEEGDATGSSKGH